MELQNREFRRKNLWDFKTLVPVPIFIILIFYLQDSSLESVYKGVFWSLIFVILALLGFSRDHKMLNVKDEGIMFNNTLVKWEEINEILFTVWSYTKNVIEISTNKKGYTIRIMLYEDGKELRDLIEEYCKNKSIKHKVEDAARMWGYK